MTYEQNLIKAMNYDYPDEIPIAVNILPAAWIHYGDEMRRFAADYPEFITAVPKDDAEARSWLPDTYRYGTTVDEWGCVWSNNYEGMEAIVTKHPVPNRGDILSLKIPENRDGRVPHGFMYLRLLDLRGFEEAMYDFADECDELQILIDKAVEYNCIQIEIKLPKVGEVMSFGDDLGMQKGLAVGADKWRKYLKPCYKKMFSIVRDAGKYVYMHTDGMIYEIMPDLMDCGVNMINPQIGANGLDNLVRVCKGKIPIQLDLDRQAIPFATPSWIGSHVRECVEALYLPRGGLALVAELNYDIPLGNAAALLDALTEIKRHR